MRILIWGEESPPRVNGLGKTLVCLMQAPPYQNSVYLKYSVFFDEVYCSHTEKVYLEYISIHLGKLHGVYFKYYIFQTIKYTLSILHFFVLISILEVYFSAYCLSLFSSVYLKYTSVHTAFLCSHQYT